VGEGVRGRMRELKNYGWEMAILISGKLKNEKKKT